MLLFFYSFVANVLYRPPISHRFATSHLLWKIWGFQGVNYEECRLLGYKNRFRTSQETHYLSTTLPRRLMLCKIWVFHGCDYEECRLLGYKNPFRTSQETHFFSTTGSSQLMLCNIWGFHGGDYEELCVFWDVTPRGSYNRRFGGTWLLLHQGDKNGWTRNNVSCNQQPTHPPPRGSRKQFSIYPSYITPRWSNKKYRLVYLFSIGYHGDVLTSRNHGNAFIMPLSRNWTLLRFRNAGPRLWCHLSLRRQSRGCGTLFSPYSSLAD
jgi:hypothetical protein